MGEQLTVDLRSGCRRRGGARSWSGSTYSLLKQEKTSGPRAIPQAAMLAIASSHRMQRPDAAQPRRGRLFLPAPFQPAPMGPSVAEELIDPAKPCSSRMLERANRLIEQAVAMDQQDPQEAGSSRPAGPDAAGGDWVSNQRAANDCFRRKANCAGLPRLKKTALDEMNIQDCNNLPRRL